MLNTSQQPVPPPSVVIQDSLSNGNSEESLAKRTLLSVSEVNIWIDHLLKVQRNRKEGAAKAARKRKKVYKCGICKSQYEEKTNKSEMWIGCDECDSWFHWTCIGITEEPDMYTIVPVLCDVYVPVRTTEVMSFFFLSLKK